MLPVQVSDWQRGRSVPDGVNLLKLIRAAGVLEEPSEGQVVAKVGLIIDQVEASPELLERFEADLRRMSADISALAVGATRTADRLAVLLDAHGPA